MKWRWRLCLGPFLLGLEAVSAFAGQSLKPVSFAAIAGWQADSHGAAFAAFRRSCNEILSEGSGFSRPVSFGGRREHWTKVCRDAQAAPDPRGFIEANFSAFVVEDRERPEGLFTGYYEPEVDGSRIQTARFKVPLYRRPPNLVTFDKHQQAITGLAAGRIRNGAPLPYLTRREIEQGALSSLALELVWLEDWADAFFIHVQGSGRVRLEDGSVMRLSFAAKSGLPYTSIGAILVERGAFTREEMSMQAMRRWMRENPEEARILMWKNQSFIFFREVDLEDSELGALGAQHVQLTPRRSLAVDRSHWMFGTPIWIDTEAPSGKDGSLKAFRQLMIAQDTGSAIKGLARGDVYWGFGEAAANIAGPMKSPGKLIVLLPKAVARTLGLAP